MKIYPCNRFLLVQPREEEQQESAVLLPEDYSAKPMYSTAKVLVKPEDCRINVSAGEDIVYQTNMIEEIDINGEKHYLLLENHVFCIVSNED